MKSIEIDASYGEGGGQILRSALSLAALTGQTVRLVNIRAGRPNPGLQAQHLTAVQAVAQICSASLEGAELGSRTLTFSPGKSPQAGRYVFDVAEARKLGSAGSTGLVFQTILLPLALADGESRVTLRGGTHTAWAPPFDYLVHVYLPTLARLGVDAEIAIGRWGWYPQGGGEVQAIVRGRGFDRRPFTPLQLTDRGPLKRLWGLSATSNLPDHIGERQRQRVIETLQQHGLKPHIQLVRAPSPGPGTCVIIFAHCEHSTAGFTAYGQRGKPAEKVAEEACQAFLRWYKSNAAVDPHLADQLVLPLALAEGPSAFTTSEITNHLRTNIWVVEHFLERRWVVEDSGLVQVR